MSKFKKRTTQQTLLSIHLKELGLSVVPERQFCDRKWRFDLAVPEQALAFEISGGNWTGGHRRGEAQEDEYDKINTAQMMGWKVMQFTNAQVEDGRAKAFIEKYLNQEPHEDVPIELWGMVK